MPTADDAAQPGPQRLIPVVPPVAILGSNAREGTSQQGAALCGRLTAQGEGHGLPGGHQVRCAECTAWRPWFEAALAARAAGTTNPRCFY